MPLDDKTREEIARRLQKQTDQEPVKALDPLPSTVTEEARREHQNTTDLESASTGEGGAGIGKADETRIASREPVNGNSQGSWSAPQPPSQEPQIVNGVYIPEKPEAQKRLWVDRLAQLACSILKADPEYHKPYLIIEDVREPLRQEIHAAVMSTEAGTAYYAYHKPDWIDDDTAWALIGNAVDVGWEAFRRHYRNELILQQGQNGTTPDIQHVDTKKIVLVREYMEKQAERAAQPFIVQELLYRSNFSLLAGRAFSGKSSLAAALLRSVALGEPFLGRKTNQLRCCYLALERNGGVMAKLLCDWKLGDLVYFQDQVPGERASEYIMQQIVKFKIEFLIIDHLQHATRIQSGNDYAEVSNALKPYQDITRLTTCGILGLHHQGKPQKLAKDEVLNADDSIIDALGSEAYRAAFDSFLECSQYRGQFFFRAQPRVGSSIDRMNIEIDFDTGEIEGNDAHIAEQKVGLIGIQEFLLKNGGSATEKEIRENVEGMTKTISEALRKGVHDGYLAQEGAGGKKDPFRYSIAVVAEG